MTVYYYFPELDKVLVSYWSGAVGDAVEALIKAGEKCIVCTEKEELRRVNF